MVGFYYRIKKPEKDGKDVCCLARAPLHVPPHCSCNAYLLLPL